MKPPIRIGFKAKILVPTIGLLALLLTGITWQVSRQVTRQMEEDAIRKLATAERVFEDALALRTRNLLRLYAGTANEPSVKATTQSGDPATIRFLLDEIARARGAQLIAYVDFSGAIPAVSKPDASLDASPVLAAMEGAIIAGLDGLEGSRYVVTDQAVYEVVVAPVQLGDEPAGALVAAHRIDDEAAGELAQLGGVEVLFAAHAGIGATTLPRNDDLRTFAQAGTYNAEHGTRRGMLGDAHVMARPGSIAQRDGPALAYTLVLSYEEGLLALRRTQRTILGWSAMCILASSLFVVLVVRAAGKPLNQLTESAEAVGRGDFTRRVDVRTRDELGDLAAVFNQMVANLRRSREELEKTVVTLRQTQEQLVQREKLSAIGEFIAGVTHELNNPLTSVLGFAQMMKDSKLNETQREDLEMIVNGAERCQRIVKGLLSFARQHKPEKTAINLNTVVRNVLIITKYDLRTASIAIEENLDPNLPHVLADEHQLQQVFLNLLTNARHAMEGRGGGRVEITSRHQDGRVRVTFKDSGPGIAAENVARIFDPFFTTKPEGKGTGLGLSLCYGIIQEHEGTISVDSKPGEGAAFTVELPVLAGAAPAAGEASGAPSALDALTHGRVLVVDDEPSILELASRALASAGCEVDIALEGHAALAHLHSMDYDLIVCDIRMPGMNGPQLFERVRSLKPHMAERFIFMTGDVINNTTQHFLDTTMRPCVMKPFSLDALRQAAAQAVAQRLASVA